MNIKTKITHNLSAPLFGLVLSSSLIPAVHAEDIEIYTGDAAIGGSSNPNIMFLVDTSSSMATEVPVKPDYDPDVTYDDTAGGCISEAIYFTDSGSMPDCSTSTDYFNESALVCDQAVVGYDINGDKITPAQDGALLLVGTYSDQIAQLDSGKNWRELVINTDDDRDLLVECLKDSGIHGSGGGGPSKPYIKNGGDGYTSTVPADPDVPHPVWAGGAGNMQLFSGNFINWYLWEPADDELVLKSYLDQVKSAINIMVRGNTQVDIGLMRFDSNDFEPGAGFIPKSDGASVTYPIIGVDADRNDFFTRLDTLNASGWTPLSESYYEALLYFGGKRMDYSKIGNPGNQVTNITELSGNTYFRSPIIDECDNNYIVVLSDGKPTADDLNATRKAVLSGFDTGSCSTDITDSTFDDALDDNRDAFSSDSSTVDNCLDELAEWAFTNDVAENPDPAYPDAHDGDQHITTHTIGFKLDDAGAIQLMEDTAIKGGGKPYLANTTGELIGIFNEIIANALNINTTFSSPAVSVNAFNRSTHLDDLYFTLFRPDMTNHWDGNLKKYKLDFEDDADGEVQAFIADQDGDRAVDDTTGFFTDDARSFWSADIDGAEVAEGGVVSRFTTDRKVYTYTGLYAASDGVKTPVSGTIASTANEFQDTNAALTDAMLDIDGNGAIVTGETYRETLTSWARGLDALSEHGEINTYDDARPVMGDPLHAEPALVQYGEVAGVADLVAYVATNDGYLHAFDADDGTEIFSFVPQEVLPQLQDVMENNSGNKTYALDGNVVAWINDENNDGTISGADEHVYLYFGMRRGGNKIFALDVTNRNDPQLLWVIEGGTGDYTELGQTWSTINVEKVKDGSDPETVLIFGGGYDTAQDAKTERSADSVGRTVYIANAETGARIWSAGVDGVSTAEMVYSIPARVKPLDTTGDGYIDRLYAADMGGQIFRFDIDNTNGDALVDSITGGRIIDIAEDSSEQDNRRIYYPPDVALVDNQTGRYNAIVFSTGYRAHPLDTKVHDRIYMVKDFDTGPITSGYDTVTEADLRDVTANLAGGEAATDAEREDELDAIGSANGWYISLNAESGDADLDITAGDFIGEKGLAEPLLLEGVAIVTTYVPPAGASDNSCGPNVGDGKVFFLDLDDGTAAFPSDLDSRSERHIVLKRGGIPPSPNVIITEDGVPTLCVGTECDKAALGLGARRTYWNEVEQ